MTTKQELESRASVASKDYADWLKDATENPSRAMRWADEAFRNAAKIAVFGQALLTLDHHGDAALERVAQNQLRNKAREPMFSTQITANLYAQHELSAWAAVVDIVAGRV